MEDEHDTPTPLSNSVPGLSSFSSPPSSRRPPPIRTRTHSGLNERSPLLRSRENSYDEPLTLARDKSWTNSLKKSSSRISDLLSGHRHSSGVARPGDLADGDPVEESSSRSIKKRKSFFGRGGYDSDFRQELKEGDSSMANGVRQWYDNYHTIDWQHDCIKNSLRMRKLRTRKRTEGIRGRIVNLWDGTQGWLLVTIVGLVTAAIAFCIIRSEALLFDLKEGYCSTNARLTKARCCPAISVPSPTYPVSSLSRPVRGAVSATGFLHNWQVAKAQNNAHSCEQWRTWGQVWSGHAGSGKGGEGDSWWIDYGAFVVLAIIFSTTASTLTIYLTSSSSVYSSKDSPSAPFPGFSPNFPAPTYGATDASDSNIPLRPSARVRKTTYFAAGSGIPEIKAILSGLVMRGYLGSWTLFVKSIGLALSVASGLSLGKEGPFVHIASCVGNIASRFFPKYDLNEAKRREVISAACAAGVAVSFGAPVGGTLFSLEEVSYFFPPKVMWRSFFCAMVAAMTLKLFDPFSSGKIVLFAVTYDRDWHTFELLGFLGLGVLGGVYGALFCKANIWYTKNIRNGTMLKFHPIFEVALLTFVTVVISFRNPFTKMGGTELVYELFSECHKDNAATFDGLCVNQPSEVWPLVASILFALVTKGLLTIATFGIKLPAGIFIPTLAVGACTGRIAGLLVELIHARSPENWFFEACRTALEEGPLPFGQACVLPGVWAMVGAAAFLAGVTRTTVSLAVIMFELTGTLGYTVPVMLSVLAAKTVADSLEPRSIYDLVIELNDLPYLDAKAEYIHEASPAEVMDEDAPVISLDNDNTLTSLREELASLYTDGSGSGFPIVAHEDGGERMYGFISAKELEHGLASAGPVSGATPCMFRNIDALKNGMSVPNSQANTPGGCDLSWLVDSAPVRVNHRSPMEFVHELFVKLGVRYVVVVDDRGLYRGVIEKNRYLAYLKFVERSMDEPVRTTFPA